MTFALPSSSGWRALGLGQVISLLVAGTGVCSQALAASGVNMPTSQSALNYVLLSSFLWVRLIRAAPCYHRALGRVGCAGERGASCCRDSAGQALLATGDVSPRATAPADAGISGTPAAAQVPVRGSSGRDLAAAPADAPRQAGGCCGMGGAPWWVYLIVALMDVEANFLVVSAYQYTTITSVMLLDCLSIPGSMLLLYTALGTRFSPRHLVAALACLGGVVALVFSDAVGGGSAPDDDKRWVGDLLCVGGAALYSLSNVSQEVMVRLYGPADFLGAIGAFGTLISALQIAIVAQGETEQWSHWDDQTALLVAGFAGCLFAMYVLTARFLQASDAAVFNLSLLTSDMWAILASAVIFGDALQPLYFVALALVVAGLVGYHAGAAPRDVDSGGCVGGYLHRLGWRGSALQSEAGREGAGRPDDETVPTLRKRHPGSGEASPEAGARLAGQAADADSARA